MPQRHGVSSHRNDERSVTAASGQRVDKWMFHARITKTRSEAARLVEEGAVRINRVKVLKPAAALHVDDVLTVVRFGKVRVYRVRALSDHRLSARLAEMLREEL